MVTLRRRQFCGQAASSSMALVALTGCSPLPRNEAAPLSLHAFLSPAQILASTRADTAPDATEALMQFAQALATGRHVRALIPAGHYQCHQQIRVESPHLLDLSLHAIGAHLVITAPMSAPGSRYLSLVNTARQGRRLEMQGLNMRHDRPVGRVPNTDMIRLGGFQDYLLVDVEVGSSDNMGIAIGRADARDRPARSITMVRPRVGGHREATPHEYASIGDSGIWIVNAPTKCDILSPWVRETGDDGILVGESQSPDAGHVNIEDADVADCGGNGICVSVPHGQITGRIRRTNQSGVALQKLQHTQASDFRVQVLVEDAGQLQAGDIGTRMIPKWNPWGLWIYQGQGGGRIDLTGSTVRRSLGAGINLQTHDDGCWGEVHGVVHFEAVGQRRPGAPAARPDVAVIRRSGTGRGSLRDVRLTAHLDKVQCPWVLWLTTGQTADRDIELTFHLDELVVQAQRLAVPAWVRLAHQDGASARVQNFHLRLDDQRLPPEQRLWLKQHLRENARMSCGAPLQASHGMDCTPLDTVAAVAQIL